MGSTCGEGSGQNDQKLHENYKISILGAKQCGEAWGHKSIFWVMGGSERKNTRSDRKNKNNFINIYMR